MVKLITVHGTFAGDEADEGEKWWQRGSPFLTELQEHIEEPLEVEPFHWSGNNSEMERRTAGTNLGKTIRDSEEPPIVIGHSHGGSSAIHALLWLFLKKGPQSANLLRGLITIGTPMIRFASNANPLTRYNIIGRILFIVAISLLIASFALSFQATQLELTGEVAERTISQKFFEVIGYNWLGEWTGDAFWTAMFFFALLFAFGIRNYNRQKHFKRNTLFNLYKNKYTTLSHRQDEAIGGLIRGKDAKPSFITWNAVFVGVFSVSSAALIGSDFGSDVTKATIRDNHYYAGEGFEERTNYIRPFDLNIPLKLYGGSETITVYDYTGIKSLHTRNPLKAIPVQELWEAAPVREFLDNNDAFWTTIIRVSESVDGDFADRTEYVFVRAENEDQFYEIFTAKLQSLQERYSSFSSYSEAPADFQSLIVEMNLYAYSTVFPPAFFAVLTREDIEPYLNDGILKTDTRISSSVAAGIAFDEDCLQGYYLEAHICDLLYAKDDPWMRDLFFEGGNFKNFALDILDNSFGVFLGYSQGDIAPSGLDLLLRILVTMVICGVSTVILAFILQPLISALVTGTLKAQAYGDDGYGEKIRSVHPSLDFTDDTVGTLPDSVQQEMIDNSLIDAPAAIQRLRVLLEGGDLGGEAGVDPMATATKFEKSELIHNAYFHSSLFIKYLAAQLIEKYGLTPSRKFKADHKAMAYKYTL